MVQTIRSRAPGAPVPAPVDRGRGPGHPTLPMTGMVTTVAEGPRCSFSWRSADAAGRAAAPGLPPCAWLEGSPLPRYALGMSDRQRQPIDRAGTGAAKRPSSRAAGHPRLPADHTLLTLRPKAPQTPPSPPSPQPDLEGEVGEPGGLPPAVCWDHDAAALLVVARPTPTPSLSDCFPGAGTPGSWTATAPSWPWSSPPAGGRIGPAAPEGGSLPPASGDLWPRPSPAQVAPASATGRGRPEPGATATAG